MHTDAYEGKIVFNASRVDFDRRTASLRVARADDIFVRL